VSSYTEDTLVQQTTAEYLERQLGWESVYAYNNENFGQGNCEVVHPTAKIISSPIEILYSMSGTVFTKVDYDLGTLVKFIGLGEIGLPDIQRPFIWKNAKVRDLFDSMYKGYPVGYLLLWQNGLTDDSRTIGTDSKQKPPRLVIVDGQQRLTSLYAVLRGTPVVRDNYESEQIYIAFNPLEERFEVADAAIRRDATFRSRATCPL
jgi:hypothetical protein